MATADNNFWSSTSSKSLYEEKIELMGSTEADSFIPRIARFLNPIANPPTESAPIFKPQPPSNLLIKGWNRSQNKWAEWVDQMAGKYSSIWIKAGIFDSIITSIYQFPFHPDINLALFQFWSPKTNTFIFPWGEATVTLEDVMILGGYSVLGQSIHGFTLANDLAKRVEILNGVRLELVRSKTKKASHVQWIERFKEKDIELEHSAFLSLWLSSFVFPSSSIQKHVFPMAVMLSEGAKLALAPAVLASIYHNSRKLKAQDGDSSNCINVLGSFRLVQIWAYERFPVLGPKKPNELRNGESRLARWHMLRSDIKLPLLNPILSSPKNFIWRPYAVEMKNWHQPSYYQDEERILFDSLTFDEDLQSFVKFLHPCELNGIGCKEMYTPHRVAMQFGFDQDIPASLSNSNFSSNFAKFFVPSRSFQPGVSKRYSNWWKSSILDGDCAQKNGLVQEDDLKRSQANGKAEKSWEKDLEVETTDGFDDILTKLKNICNSTKRKIAALKAMDPESNKRYRQMEHEGESLAAEQVDLIHSNDGNESEGEASVKSASQKADKRTDRESTGDPIEVDDYVGVGSVKSASKKAEKRNGGESLSNPIEVDDHVGSVKVKLQKSHQKQVLVIID